MIVAGQIFLIYNSNNFILDAKHTTKQNKNSCPKLLSFQIEYWVSNFLFSSQNYFWECNYKLGIIISIGNFQFPFRNPPKNWKFPILNFGNVSNFNFEIFPILIWKYLQPTPSPDRVKFGNISKWKIGNISNSTLEFWNYETRLSDRSAS